ncbi:response regulator transcription factor [Algoriphagus sp. H41]|uniref:Response regulator transcription factor n=1 Tax=Algoriphagus oliviformis TaxID=2811231 RepID=A0ABS3CBQ4_9BACT|nr:LytTR family DNA-binding domain-containing protein [Algoriphagus oliviformis]MBN7813069.1 response regulator transcription factor [Algoriphagus oliviformis]
MDCIVLDDESVSREIVRFLCEKEPDIKLIGSFSSPIEAFKLLNQQEVDLIFLDIHMPDFSGFEFIQTLKKPPLIIITSSDVEQATEVFDYESIIDFLKKPINPDKFQKAINKARKILEDKEEKKEKPIARTSRPSANPARHLYINIDKKLIKLEVQKISFVEAQGDYVSVQGEAIDYRVHTTLTNMAQKLPEEIFFRVHRSYLINLLKIIDIQDNTILIDKSVIPISRSKRVPLMQKLNLI